MFYNQPISVTEGLAIMYQFDMRASGYCMKNGIIKGYKIGKLSSEITMQMKYFNIGMNSQWSYGLRKCLRTVQILHLIQKC